jgi:hypothetical protein
LTGIPNGTVVNSLPNEFADLKEQASCSGLAYLEDWTLFPGYKFVSRAFRGETLFRFKRVGKDYKVSGIRVFSNRQNKYAEAELLINKNLIVGLQIDNSNYELSEFDLTKVDGQNATKSPFEFPKSGSDKFIESLDQEIREMLNVNDFGDIELGNKTFYTFYDMQDGNYLAVDKNQNVYSLVHDARPTVQRIDISFRQILSELKEGVFDKKKHLDERYSNSK